MTDFGPRFFVATKAQSKSIDFNNGIITQAKLTSTHTGNGNISFFMSADGGSNFEIVTSGTLHTFINTGTDLRWKADGSGITITQLKITNYH